MNQVADSSLDPGSEIGNENEDGGQGRPSHQSISSLQTVRRSRGLRARSPLDNPVYMDFGVRK